jgi:hypothetical protein
VYKHFRFTPRTTRVVMHGFILVPGAMYYLASQTNVRCYYIHLFCVLFMVIAVEMELGREAIRGGIGTVVIIPRNIPRMAYTVMRRHSYKLSSTRFCFQSEASLVQNLLHNSRAILHPPPTTVLSNACAGAR